MAALFSATEEGNLAGVQELLESATSFDINQKNKVCRFFFLLIFFLYLFYFIFLLLLFFLCKFLVQT